MDTTARNHGASWNGRSGAAWTDLQELLDQLMLPFQNLLVDTVARSAPRRVLDVGCGTGGTTVAISDQVESVQDCLGIDISDQMIAGAQARAAGRPAVRFLRADAQAHAFAPAAFDVVASRFGVMFFDDPLAAFANLRRASADDARLAFIAWRGIAENPFMTTAERAAAPLLPDIPPRIPDAPGQFAFADDRRVAAILRDSGWAEAEFAPIDVECTLPERDLETYFTRLGPLGLLLPDVAEPTRAAVVDAVRAAFAPFVHGPDVRYTAACWHVTARAA